MYWILKKTTYLTLQFSWTFNYTLSLRTMTILLNMCKNVSWVSHSFISAYPYLPDSSCHFWEHKSLFIYILHQSSVPSDRTPLYFSKLKHIYFGQRIQLKSSFLDIRVLESKFIKFLMSVLKWQVNPFSNFALFSIVMTQILCKF